jgi:hypothetical protein
MLAWPGAFLSGLASCLLFVLLQVEKSAADAAFKAEYDKLLADSTEQKAQVRPGRCAAVSSLRTSPRLSAQDSYLDGVVLQLLQGARDCLY